MKSNEIRVTKSRTGNWLILEYGTVDKPQSYIRKDQAVAYARLIARTKNRVLYIDGPDGDPRRQTQQSLNY